MKSSLNLIRIILFALLAIIIVSCSNKSYDSLSDEDIVAMLESYVNDTYNRWPTDVFIEAEGDCGRGESLSAESKNKNIDAVWFVRYNYTFAETPDATANGFNYTEDTAIINKSDSHFWVEASEGCP